jgi:hypothetical protein
MKSPHADFADLLEGAAAIADYIGENYRRTTYLLSTGTIPGWKVGTHWYSTKTKLRRRYLGEDAAEAPDKGRPKGHYARRPEASA